MRIIYNTSFIIDEDIETAWIGFIRKNYISVLQTNRLCEDIIFTKGGWSEVRKFSSSG